MSLEWLVESEIGYYRGPATVGLIKGQTGWIFIDSGVDADVPKKVLKALNGATGDSSLKVSAVINTHAHADHIGGNAYLQKNFNTEVISSTGEKPYIENPFLEPHYLFSAEAPKALHNKFFEAKSSIVNCAIEFVNEKGEALPIGSKLARIVDGVSLELVLIPGHSREMVGILTQEGYFFCGDLLFPKIILEKHPLLFLHDSRQFVKSLEWATSQTFKGVILTHGAYYSEHLPLVEDTLKTLKDNQHALMENIFQPMNEWEIHLKMAEHYHLEESFGDWHLNHGVVRSFLAAGLEEGLLKWENGLYLPVSQV